jgi:hypothetical protein
MDMKLFELPPFEGRDPKTGRMKLSGSAPTVVRPLSYNEEVILVVRAKVKGVGHDRVTENKTEFLARVHDLELIELHELPEGEEELARGRSFSRAVADVQAGEVPLFTDGGDQ